VTTPRRDARLPITLEVSYRTAGAFLVSYSINLSKGGIFIETAQPLPVGEQVALKFDVQGAGTLDVDGVVAWVRQGSPDGLPDGMGVQFQNLDERYGGVIDQMVRNFVGLTVLVVAASTDRLQLLARYVRSMIACDILEATDEESAEDALRRAPDLVLVDLDRGTSMGLATIRTTRAQAGEVPVIVLGGDPQAREAGRAAGASDVLATPPSFHELQASVIRMLSRPRAVEPVR
jgi:uncharacterized protein (TIGR02266 family)